MGCIFGRAFKNLGVEIPDDATSIKTFLKYVNNIQCPDQWNVIQILQDSGCFWGDLLSVSQILRLDN